MTEGKKKVELKNTVLFFGSLIVAIMFITSYAASGGGSNTSTTTTVPQNYSNAVPMSGVANAVVVNYTYSPVVTISGSNYNSTVLELTKYINGEVSSGNVITYTPNGNQFNILLNNNFTAYQLQEGLTSAFGDNVTVSGTVYVKLPSKVDMYDGTSKYSLNAPASTYSLSIKPIPQIGSNVSVKILALISQTGQFVPNQTVVTFRG